MRAKEFKQFTDVINSFNCSDSTRGPVVTQGRISVSILENAAKLLSQIEQAQSANKNFKVSLSLLKSFQEAKSLDPNSLKDVVRILQYTKEMSSIILEEKIERKWLIPQDVSELDSSEKTKILVKSLSALVSYYNSEKDKLYTPYNRITQLLDVINSCNSDELSEIEQLLKDPNQSTSFSQEGEDIVLTKLLNLDHQGFYVDVGAHHPFRFSNTYKFYKMGWSGINIDPVPGFEELFKTHRVRDINLNVGVTSPDSRGELTYYSFQEPAFNSFNSEKIEDVKHKVGGEVISTIEVPCLTLDDILDAHLPSNKKIDFINIDVELYERQVLEGFSIDRWSPKCVIIEDKDFNISDPYKSWIYSYFIKHNYSLRSALFRSMIYSRND